MIYSPKQRSFQNTTLFPYKFLSVFQCLLRGYVRRPIGGGHARADTRHHRGPQCPCYS